MKLSQHEHLLGKGKCAVHGKMFLIHLHLRKICMIVHNY